MSDRILIIDSADSQAHTALHLLMEQIEDKMHTTPVLCSSVAEAQKEHKQQAASALILNMRLAENTLSPLKDVPTVVISGNIPVSTRQLMTARRILDFVSDYNPHNRKYILSLLQRTRFLHEIKALVCDNEATTRSFLARTLDAIGIECVEAKNGREALELVQEDPQIRIVFADREMPGMDGVQLTQELRHYFNKVDLPIIGMINESDPEEEMLFLRNGATDCMRKHFSSPSAMEHLQSRIMQHVQQVISFLEIKDMAQRDFLTGAYNRRHFFESGESMFANYERGHLYLAVAMLDIDNFKSVNDKHGHPTGDAVIIALSRELHKQTRRTDMVARFGGEEFCVLLAGTDPEHAVQVMERIRASVAELSVQGEEEKISFTVSIGCTVQKHTSLDKMVSYADQLLYTAKQSGKNKVVSDL
jgi:diguanylate cyclase (GGDEF)-like protein